MASPAAQPKLQLSVSIVTGGGQPTTQFAKFINDTFDRLQLQIDTLAESNARIKRNFSHTNPTTIFTATENGATATITIAAHDRVYGDSTVLAVAGGSISGLTCNTTYAVYYDDLTLADATPTYLATTDLPLAQSVAAPGRHFCGAILTPKAASGSTIESGGVYPVGSNVGGELD